MEESNFKKLIVWQKAMDLVDEVYALQRGRRQKVLPNEWGAFSGDDNRAIDTARPFALHFVSDAPWKRTKVTQLISEPVLWWHRFAAETLGWKFKVPGWWWRRALYVFLKKNPWVVGWNSRLKFHFRNAVEWL